MEGRNGEGAGPYADSDSCGAAADPPVSVTVCGRRANGSSP